MALLPKTSFRAGSVVVIPNITESVPKIRISSTPPASPSTAVWIRADLVQTETHFPVRSVERKPLSFASLFPDWHGQARCKEVDNPDDMFFGEDGTSTRTSLTVSKIREVKEFCMGCPVFTECLTHALTTPERHGIWAGTSKRTRHRILALIEQGRTTVSEVVADYLEGRERKYESARRAR